MIFLCLKPRSFLFGSLMMISVITTCPSGAVEPAWWAARGIVATDGQGNRLASLDHAVINQGQLKNFVVAAAAELELMLPGGDGAALEAAISGWYTSDLGVREDFASANIGQVKALASLVYDRLISTGAASAYPWTGGSPSADYAVANIGQVKALFAFDLSTDSDSDGMPDIWEHRILAANTSDGLTTLAHVTTATDYDQDGLNDLLEWQAGTNPSSPDTDLDGMADGWEVQYQFNPKNPADAAPDADSDGWSNLEEFIAGTNPRVSNATLPVVSVESFVYDRIDRLKSMTSPAPATLTLDKEGNIESAQ